VLYNTVWHTGIPAVFLFYRENTSDRTIINNINYINYTNNE